MMQLIGRDFSPFTRRVGVSMKLLDIPFEWKALSVVTDREQIQAFNPLVRVPALVVEPGEPPLVESSQILSYIDSLAEPARRLTPDGGPLQRRVLWLTGVGTGAIEKGISSYYERTRRPKEYLFPQWVAQCDQQVDAALAVLESAAGEAAPWLAGERLTQADVTAVCAFDFLGFAYPDADLATRHPRLAALTQRAYALQPFAETSLEKYR